MSILIATLTPLLVSNLELAPIPVAAPAAPTRTVAITQPVTETALPAVITDPRPPVKVNPAGIPVAQTQPGVIRVNAPEPAPEAKPAPAPQAAEASFDRDEVIRKTANALSSVRTAEGRFTQQDSGGSASGKFYISRPGKVRFDYTSPETMHIVSDGVSVSIEEPERDAYDAVPLGSTQLSLFLRDDLDFDRDGNVVDVSASDVSYFVALEDESGEADGQMILEFRRSDFELLGWRAIDGAGGQTFVSLNDVKTGTKLRPSLFVVRDPADRNDNRR